MDHYLMKGAMPSSEKLVTLKFAFAMLLSVFSGKIEYLPDAHRPWLISGCGNRLDGRGRTLRLALRSYRERYVRGADDAQG